MNEKKTKRYLILAALAGAAAAWLLRSWDTRDAAWALRQWLRDLSLSGTGGNCAAWGIVLGVSALPAFGLFWRGRRQADWLLLLTGAELFAGLYYLVNPMLIFHSVEPETAAGFWAMGALSCAAATMAAWALLRALSALEMSPVKLLPMLLEWAAVLYCFLAAAGEAGEVLPKIKAVQAGNTDPGRVFSSAALLCARAGLSLVPVFLSAWVLRLGCGLISAMEEAPFAAQTVALAQAVASRCGLTARISLLTAVACNLLQLIWMPWAADVHFTMYLPVGALALCAAMLVLCRYFQRAKDISDDNDSII